MAEPKVLVIVLAGGEGKRLLPLTNDRAKPAVPFGGSLPLIDFALSNFANAALPQDRRAHPVQEPQPRPPHQPDVAVLDAARRLRGAGAGPDAAGPVLVPGLGRRDLPEPQPDLRRATPTSCASSAPTTSTAWTRARWSTTTAQRCRRHGGGDPGAQARGASTSASSRSDAAGVIVAFHEKSPTRRRCPATTRVASRRWATTCSTPRR